MGVRFVLAARGICKHSTSCACSLRWRLAVHPALEIICKGNANFENMEITKTKKVPHKFSLIHADLCGFLS
jgi:hypothetical protein